MTKSQLSSSRLAFDNYFSASLEMGLPSEPVTLTVEQLGELNRQLANMRHDINNNLSLIVAAAELIRHKPQVAERMMVTLAEQPGKITATINKFSTTFEQAFGITRP
jgi:aspartokinase